MAQLASALLHLAMPLGDPVQGPERATIEALVEQAGLDLRRGLIDEPRLARQVDDVLALVRRLRPRGLGSEANRRNRPPRRSPAAMEAGARSSSPSTSALFWNAISAAGGGGVKTTWK
ncbi:MAG: hypothetical protein KGM15_05705 [Pseudomonadota bacterium]|nr:hypothetical protein [Pseudomonadota bacterium]